MDQLGPKHNYPFKNTIDLFYFFIYFKLKYLIKKNLKLKYEKIKWFYKVFLTFLILKIFYHSIIKNKNKRVKIYFKITDKHILIIPCMFKNQVVWYWKSYIIIIKKKKKITSEGLVLKILRKLWYQLTSEFHMEENGSGYSTVDYFVELLGKTVDELWTGLRLHRKN